MSVQTNKGIRRLMDSGEIVMIPMRPEQINNGSVDVTLGRYVARIKPTWRGGLVELNKQDSAAIFDIEDLMKNGGRLKLAPGERVLAHTHEFIGSRRRSIPQMHAKSTTARWGITVCICAGLGDTGYTNRWTLEILNINPFSVTIEIGSRIGQLVFHEVEEPEDGTIYSQPGAGNYQQGDDMDKLIKEWKPTDMLPKTMKVVPFDAFESNPFDMA